MSQWVAALAHGSTYSGGRMRDIPMISYHPSRVAALQHLFTECAALVDNVNVLVRLRAPTGVIVLEAQRINGEWHQAERRVNNVPNRKQ